MWFEVWLWHYSSCLKGLKTTILHSFYYEKSIGDKWQKKEMEKGKEIIYMRDQVLSIVSGI